MCDRSRLPAAAVSTYKNKVFDHFWEWKDQEIENFLQWKPAEMFLNAFLSLEMRRCK